MRAIASALVFSILLSSFLFDSGFSIFAQSYLSSICECNHSSSQEIHSKHEHKDLTAPDCHSAKQGEAHICVCKRTKKSSQNLARIKQIYFITPTLLLFSLALKYEYLGKDQSITLLSGYTLKLIKPPRLSSH